MPALNGSHLFRSYVWRNGRFSSWLSLSSIITYIAQRAGHSVALLQELPLWQRTLNAAIGYGRYLLLTFWPNPLTAYYYYDVVHIQYAAAILSIAALALITFACWHFRKDKPYCLVGWLWFLGTFVPVIGFVQVGEQFMAERYTYLPLIGIFIAVVWLIGEAVAKSPRLRGRNPATRDHSNCGMCSQELCAGKDMER